MALLCHNTDLSDGWEEEGKSEWFFLPLLRGTFLPHGDQHCLLRPDALVTSPIQRKEANLPFTGMALEEGH